MLKPTINCLLILIFLVVTSALQAQHVTQNADPKPRQDWIERTSQLLKNDSIFEDIRSITLAERSNGELTYYDCRIIKEGGILLLENDSWIRILCHSGHEEDGIGDISLALDEQGRIYQNLGHICGGIIHFINQPGQPKPVSSDEFFLDFTCDIDDEKWTEVKLEW